MAREKPPAGSDVTKEDATDNPFTKSILDEVRPSSHRLQATSKGLHGNLRANLLMRPV